MIDEIIKQLKPLINGKLIYLSQYGSHLYGLDTEKSDLDFRGIYIPNLDDITLHKDKDEINEELLINVNKVNFPTSDLSYEVNLKKVDVKIFSLQKFITLCSKADTNALDLLFSIDKDTLEQYIYSDTEIKDGGHTATSYIPVWYIINHRDKLINTDRLESPVTYAFKQATKYGLSGERLKVLQTVLEEAKRISSALKGIIKGDVKTLLMDGYLGLDMKIPKILDNNYLKIDELDNKGKLEKYLNVCGVQHQFNLELDKFIKRIEEKINKEYTSQRTKDAVDGNDWKALSHALRVLLEIKELLETGNIYFPLQHKDFLLDVKLGRVDRDLVDSFFRSHFSGLLEAMDERPLNWKYDEKFWNEFILRQYKGN